MLEWVSKHSPSKYLNEDSIVNKGKHFVKYESWRPSTDQAEGHTKG